LPVGVQSVKAREGHHIYPNNHVASRRLAYGIVVRNARGYATSAPMPNKIKHLEFIQTVISRQASNSFLIKGWSLTVVGGIFALSSNTGKAGYLFVAYVLLLMFWSLDAYFLCVEKCYRALYNEVRQKEEKDVDFSMELTHTARVEMKWFKSAKSDTLPEKMLIIASCSGSKFDNANYL